MVGERSISVSESITALSCRRLAVLTRWRTVRVLKRLPNKSFEREHVIMEPFRQQTRDRCCITAGTWMMKGNKPLMKWRERQKERVVDSPRDLPGSPEACYRGCGGAWGSWEEFARRTPDGAYGTRPAVGAQKLVIKQCHSVACLKKNDKSEIYADGQCVIWPKQNTSNFSKETEHTFLSTSFKVKWSKSSFPEYTSLWSLEL